MIDESWALSLVDARKRGEACIEPPFSLTFYLTLGLMFWVPWFAFAALGAMFGPVLGNPGRWGLDMVFPTIFLVLVRGMWSTSALSKVRKLESNLCCA